MLAYVRKLVADGILSIDAEGRVWRHYELTRWGRKAVPTRRAENKTKKGYLAITFHVPRQRFTRGVLAHVLVWTHLRGTIPAGMQVNHKDLRKDNNRPDNLELTTGSGNIQHSYANGRVRPWSKAKEWRPGKLRLTEEQKQRARDLRAKGMTHSAIREETGISRTHIARILKGGRQ